jgi:hypothetical protein
MVSIALFKRHRHTLSGVDDCVVCENKLRLLFRLLLFARLLLLRLEEREIFAITFFL